jgi:hypothetical protein
MFGERCLGGTRIQDTFEGIGHGAESIGLCKHQIPSTKFQINLNYSNSKQNLLGHLKLEFGAYLGFGICDLGFWTLCPPPYALC